MVLLVVMSAVILAIAACMAPVDIVGMAFGHINAGLRPPLSRSQIRVGEFRPHVVEIVLELPDRSGTAIPPSLSQRVVFEENREDSIALRTMMEIDMVVPFRSLRLLQGRNAITKI
jgi:hypothetical protein